MTRFFCKKIGKARIPHKFSIIELSNPRLISTKLLLEKQTVQRVHKKAKKDKYKEERIEGIKTCRLWRKLIAIYILLRGRVAPADPMRCNSHFTQVGQDEASEARKFRNKPVPAHKLQDIIITVACPGQTCWHSGANARVVGQKHRARSEAPDDPRALGSAVSWAN